jgi:hypothetical protein
MLSTSFHITRVKADHCHPTNTGTPAAPATPAKNPAGTTESNLGRQRNSTRVLSINNKQFKTGVTNIERKPVASKTLSFEEIYSKDLPIAISSIGEAVKAIKSGDRQTELAELNIALDKLITVYKALGTQEKLQYANSLHCPIMGSAIDINKVDKDLIRDYKGRKIAFCCAGCPSAWDKLTEEQKQKNVPGLK